MNSAEIAIGESTNHSQLPSHPRARDFAGKLLRSYRLLRRRKSWFRADVSAASSFRSLATQFHFGFGTIAYFAPSLVDSSAGGAAGSPDRSISEPCSTSDDSVLVREQLLRSADRSHGGAPVDPRSDAIQSASEHLGVLSVCRVCWTVPFFVPGRSVRYLESIWKRLLLGNLEVTD